MPEETDAGAEPGEFEDLAVVGMSGKRDLSAVFGFLNDTVALQVSNKDSLEHVRVDFAVGTCLLTG